MNSELAPDLLEGLNTNEINKAFEQIVGAESWDEGVSRSIGEGLVPLALNDEASDKAVPLVLAVKAFKLGPKICGSVADKGEDDEDH